MKHFFSKRWLAAIAVVLATLLGGATAYAADSHPFTLYFPTDDQTINALKKAASDGGIGSSDRDGVLSQTKLYTKGTKLGVMSLSISSFSDDHDMPIYSRDYYCTPLNNKITTTKPSASTLYIRYTLAVGLYNDNSWSGIVSDSVYPSRVGVLGGNHVGTLHIPAKIDNDASSSTYTGYDAKDLPIFGVNGDKDIRDYGVLGNDGDAGGAPSPDEISDAGAWDDKFNALVNNRGVNKTLQGCLPPHHGDTGDYTSNYSKLSQANKKDWKDRLEAAGITLGASTPSGGGSVGEDSGDAGGDSSCQGGALGWILCPMIDLLSNTTTFAANMVDSLLQFRVLAEEADNGNETIRSAWQGLLSVANIFLVLAFLVIIFSQSTSLGLSNYGIKRMLPRLILAAILINVSFFICALLVDISNIVGSSVMGFLNGPQGIGEAFKSNMDQSGGFAQALVGGVAIVAIVFFFLLPVLLAVLLVLLLLIARLVILGVLIVISPLAFAAWLLPNTESYFKKWWDLFTKLLFIYPVIMAIFGASLMFSKISDSFAPQGDGNQTIANLISLAILAIPLFVLPKILMSTNSMMGQVGGLGQKLSGKIQGGAIGKAFGAPRRAAGNTAKSRAAFTGANLSQRLQNSDRWGTGIVNRGVERRRTGAAKKKAREFSLEARKQEREQDIQQRMGQTLMGSGRLAESLQRTGGTRVTDRAGSEEYKARKDEVSGIEARWTMDGTSAHVIAQALRDALDSGSDDATVEAAISRMSKMGAGSMEELATTLQASPIQDASTQQAVSRAINEPDVYGSLVKSSGDIAKGGFQGDDFVGNHTGLGTEQAAVQSAGSLERWYNKVSTLAANDPDRQKAKDEANIILSNDNLRAQIKDAKALDHLTNMSNL